MGGVDGGRLSAVWGGGMRSGGRGGVGAELPALGDFCIFYAYLAKIVISKNNNTSIKAFKISLNVLNRINEVQVL